jgi:aspartate/methionine/tyrosine aminotransferase
MDDLGKLIEYNTSCAPGFVQRAGIAAITLGDDVVARTRSRFHDAQRLLVDGLNRLPGVEAAMAPGAMYAFFRIAGVDDSLDFCKRMVRDVGLGLAPGSAFGAEGEGFVRWCFAASAERLTDGLCRLESFLSRHPR